MRGSRTIASLAAVGLVLLVCPNVFGAESFNISIGTDSKNEVGAALKIVGVMTALSLAPAILLTTTSFVRVLVVLSLLRTALGTQS